MAEAIPSTEWTSAEEYQTRLFYWDYLVSHWLVPGPSIIKHPPEETPLGTQRVATQDYGWLLEPDSLIEQ